MASCRAQFIISAVDQFADDMPSVFRRLGRLYAGHSLDIVALFNEDELRRRFAPYVERFVG